MSTRLSTYRHGDRSEYLAVYLLSALGLVTQVPRQEDIGFDLVCSIADNEVGNLTFNHQYVVSVKSLSHPSMDLMPSKQWKEGCPIHIDWLFRLGLPLILAVVDKTAGSISLFSTLPVWYIYHDPVARDECRALSLKPRIGSKLRGDVGFPVRGKELKFPEKYHYTVDLGFPICVFGHADLKNDRIKEIKARLRDVITFAKRSIMYMEVGAHYFEWFARTSEDCSIYEPAFYIGSLDNPRLQKRVFSKVAPMLACAAMHYKDTGNITLLDTVGAVLRLCPPDAIDPKIKAHLPEIWPQRSNR